MYTYVLGNIHCIVHYNVYKRVSLQIKGIWFERFNFFFLQIINYIFSTKRLLSGKRFNILYLNDYCSVQNDKRYTYINF